MNINIKDTPIYSMSLGPSSSGIVMGVRLKDRDVHLTYCLNMKGELDCHIKDNGETVWRETVTVDEMEKMFKKAFERGTFKWRPSQKLMVLDAKVFEVPETIVGKTTIVDILSYLQNMASLPWTNKRHGNG